jgi:phage shock protein C
MNDRLYRSRDERVIGGVAGGLADYLGLDPALVRVLWVVLAILSGGGFVLAYIAMLIVVPEEPDVVMGAPTGTAAAAAPTAAGDTSAAPAGTPDWRALRAAERAREREARAQARAAARSTGGGTVRHDRGPIVLGLILVLLGIWFLLDEYLPELDLGRLWPLLLVGFGVVVLAGAVRRGGGGPASTGGPGSPTA